MLDRAPITPAFDDLSCITCADEIEFENFRTENGKLDVLMQVRWQARKTGNGFHVSGQIASVKIGALTFERCTDDPFACKLLGLISENHDAAICDLEEMDEIAAQLIAAEYDVGDRTL
jgi:hypothetical protein